MAQPAEKLYSLPGKRVFVAGHRGMVGSALCRRLSGEVVLQTAGRHQLDLCRQAEVEEWFAAHRPQAVFVAAAKVGGINANSKLPADFLYDNLAIETNVIEAARKSGVGKSTFPWLRVYVSQDGPAADRRGRIAERCARTHQRMVRYR
jgi:GDP-L-fucose synthase